MSRPAARRRPRQPMLDELVRQCEAFNDRVDVGASVTVRTDRGEIVATKTTSEAYVLGGHSAVVHLQDVSGCYLLDRVKPVDKDVHRG